MTAAFDRFGQNIRGSTAIPYINIYIHAAFDRFGQNIRGSTAIPYNITAAWAVDREFVYIVG
jgi:hypothetical protein